MQDILKSTFEEVWKCIQCASIKPKYISSNYILIETVNYGLNKIHSDLPIVFNISPTINLFDKQLTLRGIINFIQPPKYTSIDAIGHYV